jgi:hypothetical protein
MMNGTGLCLSQSQLRTVRDFAARILPPWRNKFMFAVADELMTFDPVDDAAVRSACARLLARMPSARRLT